MSYYTKHTLFFVLVIVMLYLAGSFLNASLNLTEWNPFVRWAIVAIWLCIVACHGISLQRAANLNKPSENYN